MQELLNWSITKIHLPLKFSWRISRSECEYKNNYIIKVKQGDFEGMGEVALNSRYGELDVIIEKEFKRFLSDVQDLNGNVESFNLYLNSFRDLPNSLRFGIESAMIQLLSKKEGKSVADYLNVNDLDSRQIFFSLPIMSLGEISAFIEKYNLDRFSSLKLKVDKDSVFEKIKEVVKVFPGSLCLDFNEGICDPDEIINLNKRLEDFPILFIEQPLPARMHDEYLYLKKKVSIPIFADESITNQIVDEYFQKRFHGVNIKLMKSGSYFTALKQLQQAKSLGIETMLGSMVETTLGVSSALNISDGFDYYDLDGFLFMEKEPFCLVQERKGSIYLVEN